MNTQMDDVLAGTPRQDPASKAVAVRSIYPADAWNAYGVMTVDRGGHWASASEVADWPLLVEASS